jgi:hypothetical protein
VSRQSLAISAKIKKALKIFQLKVKISSLAKKFSLGLSNNHLKISIFINKIIKI